MATTRSLHQESPSIGVQAPANGLFAAFSVQGYPRLWTIGLLWNLARWMSVFLCTYLMNRLTHSPFLVQAVGASFFAPMFLTGALGGVISDRLDRRRTMLALLLVLMPVSSLMAAGNMAELVKAWMVYPFMLVVGVSMVVDMTSRRALVYDLAGKEYITNALALESLAMTGGTLLGGLGAGAIISALGIGQAFVLVAAAYVLSFSVLLGVRHSQPNHGTRTASKVNVISDLRAAFYYVGGNRALISILGVTVIMNVFYHSFIPMIPVFADRMQASPFWTGVLATGPALGSITGAFLIARGLPIRRGMAYFGGSLLALAFLCAFAVAGWYPLALACLVLAGLGISGFSTMQSALVMITAGDAMRGRAMGLLSMAIGVLPFAMLTLGGVAQVAGPRAGVAASALTGIVFISLWSARWPEARRVA